MAGKYRILQTLGKGGEGSVWLAIHVQTEQFWAVKEIARKGDGREFHEIDIMKKLRHPSLPLIADVLESETSIYLVMEYIRGHTLEEILRRQGSLSPWQVMEVGIQLSGVLCYLHGRKRPILHLDIKPANIIQKRDGTLVLVDFGSSWKLWGENQEGKRRGTEGFAAPEQYDPKRALDGRTDIYGLGATLYYLISGVTYSSALKKSRIPGCPEAMSGMIRKCIREEPGQRYQDSKKLRREIMKLRRRYRWERQRIQLWAALLLAIFALGLALRELPAEFSIRVEEQWNYEKLLSEALCSSGEERLTYYEQALFRAPGRKQAYLQLLEQAGSDGMLEESEEKQIRTLLHTIPPGQRETYEELLAKNFAGYGEVAFRLGMLYWYSYEGEEGHRIASGWFRKATETLRKLPENRERKEWEIRAEIFGHRSVYFDRLGFPEETGENQQMELAYWEDLKQILALEWETEDSTMMELYFLRETFQQMIFLAEDLWYADISAKEQMEVAEQLEARVGEERLKQAEDAERKRVRAVMEEGGERIRELRQEVTDLAETAKMVISHLGEK